MTNIRTPWRAVAAMFVLNGALFGMWASRIPAVKEALTLGHGELGLALLFMAAGAIASFQVAGRLVDRHGAAKVTRLIAYFYTVSLGTIPLAPGLWALAAALFVFGTFHGSMDVAMNAWGAEVERRSGRPCMSSFHAMFSVGAGLGAFSGYGAATLGIAVTPHFAIAGATIAAATIALAKLEWRSDASVAVPGSVFTLPRGPLAIVGLVAFCASLGEGAMADWSAVFLRDVAQASEGRAALGYAIFSVAMVVVRLLGDEAIRRLGPVRAAWAGGTFAALGVLTAVIGANFPAILIGFGLMGMGYAVIMPLAFSRAANDPDIRPGNAIASVATIGYGGMLLGPPVIGFVAALTSIRASFLILAILALLIVALAGVLRWPQARLATSDSSVSV